MLITNANITAIIKGLPGIDGKDGTPGIPGMKVIKTGHSCHKKAQLKHFYLVLVFSECCS